MVFASDRPVQPPRRYLLARAHPQLPVSRYVAFCELAEVGFPGVGIEGVV